MSGGEEKTRRKRGARREKRRNSRQTRLREEREGELCEVGPKTRATSTRAAIRHRNKRFHRYGVQRVLNFVTYLSISLSSSVTYVVHPSNRSLADSGPSTTSTNPNPRVNFPSAFGTQLGLDRPLCPSVSACKFPEPVLQKAPVSRTTSNSTYLLKVS